MSSNAFTRAQKFNTRMRSLDRAEEAVHESVRRRYAEKRRAMRGDLDAEAHAIVEAAELARAKQRTPEQNTSLRGPVENPGPGEWGPICEPKPEEPEPALSPRLTAPVPDAPRPIESAVKEKGARR